MTGTSLDGIDAALVAVTGRGLGMSARVERSVSRGLGPLSEPLRELAAQRPLPAGQIAAVSRDLALLHIDVLRELAGDDRLDLVAVHGQTVFHAPPVSWQLSTPAPIARALAAPVVFDLRAADLAAGGQGAPITPLADYIFFRHAQETRAIVNFGGFCNYTHLPQDGAALADIRGGDICACNQLLDAIARSLFCEPYDAGGTRALAGQMRAEPYRRLLEVLRGQSGALRSLGTGDELVRWAQNLRGLAAPADIARSACEAIAAVVAERAGRVDRIIVAGGSARNRALVAALHQHSGVPLSLSDEFGVPIQAREAAAMAVLGALCEDGVPITLPQITGSRAPAPRSGTWVFPPAA